MNTKRKFIDEFKEFISRGSVIDLAVGVIMGSAFTAIVTSLVNDLVMPMIGLILGGANFSHLKFVISEASGKTPESAILYGNFIQSIVNFLLIALVIFGVIKAINAMKRTKEEACPEEPVLEENVALLREIRDLLREKA